MPCGLRFDERDQVLFKKKYVTCFGSRNHKGEIASLQALQEYGKSRKKKFTRENSFAN